MPTFTRNGFPWNPAWPAWHATTALSAIRKHGFKTRSEIGVHATGGGTDKAISLTLDPRVAFAIAVNLDVFRKLSLGVLGYGELYTAAQRECPKGLQETLKYRHQTEQDITYLAAGLKFLSMPDWLSHPKRPRVRWDTPPDFAMVPADGGWWVHQRDYPYSKYQTRYERGEEESQFFKELLTFGESAKECYNPLFFMTDVVAFGKIPLREIGVLEVRVDIPNVCMTARDARDFGYLSTEEARRWERFLGDEHTKCENDLDWRRKDNPAPYAMYYPPEKMGMFDVQNVGERGPNDTMAYLAAMAELRVYAPRKIHVTDAIDVTEVRALTGIGNRITFPYFDTRPYGGR